jgi:pimeloyl-ACP methyl ester carboxylesterase
VRVVLLHALPLDERMWAGFEGAAPRLYGPGRSMDEWAGALLGELAGDLVLVGASMGGYCALAMARLAPERIRGLALVGSRPDADTPERRAGRAATIETIRAEGAAGLWAAMRPKLFPDGAAAEPVERARAIALEQRPDDLVAAVEAIRDRPDSTEVWRSLAVPVLVAVGSADPFVSVDDARAFAGAAELHILEGGGHLAALERLDELRPLLDRFVERCR